MATTTLWEEFDGEGDPVGRMISGYKLLTPIGKGGMGEVYEGVLEQFVPGDPIPTTTEVAIKLLHPQFGEDLQAVDRFLAEAMVMRGIHHPNIVAIYAGDTHASGRHYLAMEMLRGQSLYAVLQEGPLPVARALHIAWQVASALEAAHNQGIIHRDLKPENIFLVKDEKDDKGKTDFVKVMDFGIAKVQNAGQLGIQTATGKFLGSAGYTGPEQATGGTVTKRSDIYALGVVLYEMLTGVKLFGAGSDAQKLTAQLRLDPAVMSFPGHVPEVLQALIRQMLAFEPAGRPANMERVEQELEKIQWLLEKSRPRRRSPRLALIVVAVATLLLVGLGFFFALRPKNEPSPTSPPSASAPALKPTTAAPAPAPTGDGPNKKRGKATSPKPKASRN